MNISLLLFGGIKSLFVLLLFLFSYTRQQQPSLVQAFVVVSTQPPPTRCNFNTQTLLYATLPDIDSMKAGEIRKELESYGISTKSFLEKGELKDALKKARDEGKTPVNDGSKRTTTTSTSSTSSSSSSREERMKEELKKAEGMKVGELKKALKEMGVSTKSFFEKSEFVKAYANAVVDGKRSPRQDEPYDPSYRDVVMRKYDPRAVDVGRSPPIDVKLGR